MISVEFDREGDAENSEGFSSALRNKGKFMKVMLFVLVLAVLALGMLSAAKGTTTSDGRHRLERLPGTQLQLPGALSPQER